MKLNFPNILVLIRLALVPIIILLLLIPGMTDINNLFNIDSKLQLYWTDIVAGALFIIASVTDFVDGWYARKYNQVTTFGKLFDPLADKILVNSTLIIFGARGIIPIIFVLIFVIRDILVDGLRMVLASNQIVLAADRWGKLKTIFQMIGLSLLFFVHAHTLTFFSMFDWTWLSFATITLLTVGLFFSIFSGFNYYVGGFRELNKIEKQ